MKKSNNKTIYVWASDFSNYRGEGVLARQFIRDIKKNSSSKIYINGLEYSKIRKKKIHTRTNFIHNYLGPFWGIFNIWINHLNSKKTIYLNYLPLWNFLIFFFLPSKTILGPVTGGANFYKENSINYFIRKFFFPLLYFISIKIINIKYEKILFSTDLLKIFLKSKKTYTYNYCINLFKKKSFKAKKKYDLIFYYRKHKNKNNIKQKLLIKKLIKYKLKVLIIGDNPEIINSLYLGNIDREKIYTYISKTKYAINSSENSLSIFSIDCLSCGTKVINFGKHNSIEKFFSSSDLIIINELNVKKQVFKILKIIKSKKNYRINHSLKNIIKKKKEIKNYFSSLDL